MAASNIERMEAILGRAPAWFVIEFTRMMVEHQADPNDGIDAWASYPTWLTTSSDGLSRARDYLKDVVILAGGSEHVVDALRYKEVQALVLERQWTKRYPEASPRVCSIVHGMLSDMRYLANGPAGRPVDVQGHWSLGQGAEELGFAQLWLNSDTDGRDGAMPLAVSMYYADLDKIVLMVNRERVPEAMELLPHLWRDGFILRERPTIVVTGFGDDVQDFARRFCSPETAQAESDSDFGAALYGAQ